MCQYRVDLGLLPLQPLIDFVVFFSQLHDDEFWVGI